MVVVCEKEYISVFYFKGCIEIQNILDNCTFISSMRSDWYCVGSCFNYRFISTMDNVKLVDLMTSTLN